MRDAWSDFTADPRTTEGGRLRASDNDRAVALGVLSEAYADGRLDRDEYDERSASVSSAKLLGELTGPLADLISAATLAASAGLATTTPGVPAQLAEQIHRQAVTRYEHTRNAALMAFVGPTMITWVIWAATMFGAFPWPAIVTVATSIGLLSTLINRQGIIANHEREIAREIAQESASLPRPELED